jgi:hypothetical protein
MARRQRVQTFSFEGTGEELHDCGDFKILDDFVADGRSITFLDSEGNADFAIVHTTFRDRFYNSETGKEVTGTSHNVFEKELPEDVEIWSAGQHYFSTVPGEGLVYMDVGTIKYDEAGNVIFEGGHHPALSDASSLSEREKALQVNLCEVLRAP